uniref:Uncharacterized protein n=1 Tax=Ditylenchus dipsaci TaxID=166011 RepID=A0A915D3B1_9BILA
MIANRLLFRRLSRLVLFHIQLKFFFKDIVITPAYRLYEAICGREPDEFLLFDSRMEKKLEEEFLVSDAKAMVNDEQCQKNLR